MWKYKPENCIVLSQITCKYR